MCAVEYDGSLLGLRAIGRVTRYLVLGSWYVTVLTLFHNLPVLVRVILRYP